MTGRGFVGTSFGAEFADGGDLLVVHDGDDPVLARERPGRIPSLAGRDPLRVDRGAAVPVQIGVLAMVPGRREVILATVVGAALIAAHEVSSCPALARSAGMRCFRARRARRWRGRVSRRSHRPRRVLFWPRQRSRLDVVADGSDASAGVVALVDAARRRIPPLRNDPPRSHGGAVRLGRGERPQLQLLLPYYPAYLATKLVGARGVQPHASDGLRALGRLDVPPRPLPRLRTGRGPWAGSRTRLLGTWRERRTDRSSTSSSFRSSCSPSSPRLDDRRR